MLKAIEIIKESKQTHQDWLDYFKKNPNTQKMVKKYKYVGNINHHKRCIRKYNKVITEIEQLQAKNKKLKNIIIETKICVAALCITGLPSLKGLKEIASMLNQGIDKGDIQQVLKGE